MSSRVCQIPEAAPATSALQPELGFCIWYVSATLVKRQALQNAMIIRYRATVLQAGAARPVYARFGQGLYSSLSLGISSGRQHVDVEKMNVLVLNCVIPGAVKSGSQGHNGSVALTKCFRAFVLPTSYQ